MPLVSRKRRRNVVADDEDEFGDTPDPPQRTQRNARPSTSRDTDNDDDADEDISPQVDEAPAAQDDADSDQHDSPEDTEGPANAQMVKNLVRLALSSEYSRTPIRRQDISTKVLGGARSRDFRAVFDAAQLVLRQTFGMELVELPAREKVTLKERRAAAATQASGGATATNPSATAAGAAAAASGTRAWVLRSLLPAKFTTPEILPPGRCPTVQLEAAYVGLYSFVVAVITLNGGVLADAKLDRYLRRVNAETSTPVDKTDRLLLRMIRDGYLVRVKENVGGEEVVEYMVGTRGRAEIGEKGVEGLVKSVYGAGEEDQEADLQKRIDRSLKIGMARTQAANAADGPAGAGGETSRRRRGRPRRGAHGDGDEDDD